MKSSAIKYCSLDIETSGFDPLKEEILEVGFAFFEVSNKGVKVTEEWTQVFKPSKPVSPQILGLTGISQEELEDAPKFSEYREFLQQKLENAVILGHNISFDLKFLQAFGLKFYAQSIDTLDLAQWLLPTHHSYNLENLMHTFGISHKEAHRALADSKAALKLLEKQLQVFSSFKPALKNKLLKLAGKGTFAWKEFLNFELPPAAFQPEKFHTKAAVNKISKNTKIELLPGRFYNFSLDQDYTSLLLEAETNKKTLFVVPKTHTALDLYKAGLTKGAIFLPETQFDEKKFQDWLKKPNHSDEEIKFLMKVLVWQEINWQTQTVLDLNLSFFGGQFKNQITGGKIASNIKGQTLICDMATFLHLSENKLYQDREAVICGLNEFETAITANLGNKASWGYLSYILKSFYNPELESGEEKFKEAVQEGLLAIDLFFGLVSALLQTDPPGFSYFKITEQNRLDEKYQKIEKSHGNLLDKLKKINTTLNSNEINNFSNSLKSFFKNEDNRVKWIELSEKGCSFVSMPLQIDAIVKKVLENFNGTIFADNLDKKILPKFFLNRLGQQSFLVETPLILETALAKSKQGDLFSGIKKAFSGHSEEINYHPWPKIANPAEIMDIISKKQALPAAVLFSSGAQVKEFYEQHYQTLKEKASVLAQSASGGSNKIFRNFSINPKSILLATDKFVLNNLKPKSDAQTVNKLKVNTLILCHIPFEQFTHPYAEAISASLPNAFEGYSLPRALYNFHSILRFFYTPELREIYIIDPKLSKPYADVFKNYYQTLPKAQLKP